MGNYISFPEDAPQQKIEKLILNLVDPATDAGSIARLISGSLGSLDSEAAANFDTDPLIDYRAQRPWVNYQNGRLAGIWREGMDLSVVKDVEGTSFLRLHGTEPDFHWDSLVADMLDVVERFGVQSIYSFTAIGTPTPHTRPADMIVRTSESASDQQVLEADFWFQSSFADYLEYHASRLGIPMTNVAVRVPVYLASQHYSAGAVGALSMVGKLAGLRFPLGDLQHDVIIQNEQLTAISAENEELARIIAAFEHEYDEKGVTPGFVTAPEDDFSVPSVDEIGRAAEQFLAQVDMANERTHVENQFDPQGLIRRIDEIRRSRMWREMSEGNGWSDGSNGGPDLGNGNGSDRGARGNGPGTGGRPKPSAEGPAAAEESGQDASGQGRPPAAEEDGTSGNASTPDMGAGGFRGSEGLESPNGESSSAAGEADEKPPRRPRWGKHSRRSGTDDE
ncbi:PAC2 family protein [Actinomycetaceae bacterium L2_0104]